MDEFVNTESHITKIKVINNTIAECKNGACAIKIAQMHNPCGKYHWTFKISHSPTFALFFGLTQNNITIASCKLWLPDGINDDINEGTYHVYLDADNNTATFRSEAYETNETKEFDDLGQSEFRLYVSMTGEVIRVEIIDFKSSNWYSAQLLHNKSNPMANIGYAECTADVNEQMKHYLIGLNTYPYVELWNEQYLYCLIKLEEYDKAYSHAITFQKGKNAIYELASYYYEQVEDYEQAVKAHALFVLVIGYEIDMELYYEISRCCRRLGEFEQALYYCRLYLERYPDSYYGNSLMCYIYDDCKDFDNGRKWALKALELATHDDDKNRTLICMGVNAYFQGNIQDAIKYTEEAMKYAPCEDGLDHSNLGKYYYKLNEYEKSYKYLQTAINMNPCHPDIIGNYGVLMYYMNRFDDALVNIKKCLESRDSIDDKELVLDLLYVYAQILYDQGEYSKSIDKCMECISDADFDGYKQKDLFFYSLSKSYGKLLDSNKSIKYLIKANQHNPNNSVYVDEIDKLNLCTD